MLAVKKIMQQGVHSPENLAELRRYLQAAVEIEHLTIPVYLTGMYTIKPESRREGGNQYAYEAVQSVVLEEMLHMSLAANLLIAVGGEPEVAHPEFVPKYPSKLPMSADSQEIHLQYFSKEALKTYLHIEHPRSQDPRPENLGHGWSSIGQFYALILQGLTALVERDGADAVFKHGSAGQVTSEDVPYFSGELFCVTDLATAAKAVREIMDQGEGVSDTIWESQEKVAPKPGPGESHGAPTKHGPLAHYFRFKELASERKYGEGDKPAHEPTGGRLAIE